MSFETPNVGGNGGFAGDGGIVGFLTQALQGYQGAHQGKMAEKQQKMDNQNTKRKADLDETKEKDEIAKTGLETQQLQFTMGQAQKAETAQLAQTKYDNIVQQASRHPEILKDPNIANGLIDAANTLGKPIVRGKDGSIDSDAIMPKQFDELTPSEKAAYAALSPGERKAQMAGIGGIPKDFMASPPVVSYKEETERIKAQTGVANSQTKKEQVKHKEHIDDAKLPYWQRLQSATTHYRQTQSTVGAANINKINEEIGHIRAETSAIPQRLELQGASLQLRSKSLDIAMQRLQYDTNPESMKNLETATRELDDFTGRTQGELSSAEDSFVKYKATFNGGDVPMDDPIGAKMQMNIHNLNDALYSAKKQSDKARGALVGHQFQGVALTRQGGGKRTTIMPRQNNAQQAAGNAPGVPDGATANGGKYVARGGKWYPK